MCLYLQVGVCAVMGVSCSDCTVLQVFNASPNTLNDRQVPNQSSCIRRVTSST